MKKRFIIFYVATFCIVAGLSFAVPAFSAILFYEDFEDTLTFVPGGDWYIHSEGGSQELTTEQVRYGSKSYKFSLTRLDAGDKREELDLRAKFNPANNSRFFTIGSEYWIGFSIFLADGYHSPNEPGTWGPIHHQYHSVPDKPPTCDWTEGTRNPVLYIKTGGANWGSLTQWDDQLFTPLPKVGVHSVHTTYDSFSTGQWYDFVINVKWSYGASGFLKIWKNGILILDRTGGNCFNDVKGPYMKIGIYGIPDQDQTVTIYYDELRIGDNNSSYSEVAPGGSVKPLPPTSVRIIDK